MQWEELRLQGQTVAVAELCSDSPELLDELQRRIRALEAMDSVLGVTATTGTVGSRTREEGATVTEGPQTIEQPRWPDLPGYEVLGKLGEGGMGVVYKVRNLAIGRVEALKMIRGQVSLHTHALQRFQLEIRATAQFEHPRVVRVYAVGQHDGVPYFTMEYVESGSLAQHMRRFLANPGSAVALIAKVARAVHYLHTKNIVHRDLKPANILLKEEHDEPLVSDFGLARLFDGEIEQAGREHPGADARLTQAGAVMGTAAYMAPEQAAGQTDKLTAATDVWALGVVLYELLTGHRPFEGKDSASVRDAVLTAAPPPPRAYQARIGLDLEAICLRCLEKNPQRRYATAQALVDDLERLQRGDPILPERLPRRVFRKVRRHKAASAIAAVCGVLVLIIAFLVSDYRPAQPPDKTAAAEANLKTVLAEVATGRRVDLIPTLGPPGAYRWASRGIHDALSEAADKPFSVNATSFALLELLPANPLQRCRLTLDVHHDGGAKDGEVGIYFSYSKQFSAQGLPIHCFCGISFNDVTPVWENLPPMEENLPKPANQMRLQSFLLIQKAAEESTGLMRHRGPPGLSTNFKPAGLTNPTPWRTLEVDLLPDQIRVAWDHLPLPPVPRARLQSSMKFAIGKSPLKPLQEPQLLPKEALGLYVYGATAWFRRCSIEALPDPIPN
jgi:serine/threonine-protein kinase